MGVGNGDDVRAVQPEDHVQKGPVLPEARSGSPERAGRSRLFAAAGNRDNRRSRKAVETRVPDGLDFDGSVKDELNRLLKLPIAVLKETPDPDTTSAGAMLARVLLKKAVLDENQNAITEVLDRIEGKAVKGATNKPNNNSLQEQIGFSLNSLNELSTPDKD